MSGSGSLFELLGFQTLAARQIADRFEHLIEDEDRPTFTAKHPVPFFQALSALTGAGKTAVLTEAVAQMAAGMSIQPVVFWVSRLRAVVSQTFASMNTGGKYASLLPGFTVAALENLDRDQLANGAAALLVLSTVGSFNQDKTVTNLAVHGVKADKGEESLWSALTKRVTQAGAHRPLFVVYDEAHNLTDPQTDLLMELRPEAFLVASATMTLRPRLQQVIMRLRDAGWSDKPAMTDEVGQPSKCLVTQISNKTVVDAGLVKREVVIGGYDSTMETMVDDLLLEQKTAQSAAMSAGLDFTARAIYVSQTNIDSDSGSVESIHRPFTARRAPPILIWRHLVSRGVDPATIAVYCDLKHNKEYPLPKHFRLFSGGDKDYEAFTSGGYRHVIFNQALQEGWDDPQVAFAYIDKTMGSATQVEQVIGRVLRQPGAEHYNDPVLNRATFYIRLDDKQQFKPILEEVQKRIGAEPGGVDIRVNTSLGGASKSRQMPKADVGVPKVYVVSDQAAVDMDAALEQMPDYSAGGINAEGAGTREVGTLKVGEDADVTLAESMVTHSSRVTARWIIRREMRTLYPRALHALDDSDHRFDAMLDRTSVAAEQFRELGRKLVDAFLTGSSLRIEPTDLHKVGPIDARPGKAIPFKNAVHDAYELNDFESKIAQVIDDTGLIWCRNPENGGWSLPLLDTGGTYNFYPDFLIWKGKDIFALDPKGGHILASNAYRKVLSVQRGAKGPRVLARLISQGRWSDDVKPLGKEGFTTWSWDTTVGRLQAKHYTTMEKSLKGALTA